MVLFPAAGVGALGVPVNVGLLWVHTVNAGPVRQDVLPSDIRVHLQLQCLVIHILAGCQHTAGSIFRVILSVLLVISTMPRSECARYLQPVAAYSFPGSAHGNQCPGLIKQAHFTYPPTPSFSGITCSAIIWLLFCGSNRAYSAQPGVSHLPVQSALSWRWQYSAAIADRHMGNF